jgi:hypothetical protein
MNKVIILVSSLIFCLYNCNNHEPLIAEMEELPFKLIGGGILCQPVSSGNTIYALTGKGSNSYITAYDVSGKTIWQKQIDDLKIPLINIQNTEILELIKDMDEMPILFMCTKRPDESTKSTGQNFKVIKFDQNGEQLWLLEDSIHMSDGNHNGGENSNYFMARKFVCLSSGYLMISAATNQERINTDVQLTYYGTDGNFLTDEIITFQGRREIKQVYSTQDDYLFFSTLIDGTRTLYAMMDQSDNLLFDIEVSGQLYETYFLFENNDGTFIISTSYINNQQLLTGVIHRFDIYGQGLNSPQILSSRNNSIFLSINKVPDGYLFSGYQASEIQINPFDWRNTSNREDHFAIILKTNMELQNQWEYSLNQIFPSIGAISAGHSPLCFFGADYENKKENLFFLKLNNEGSIFSK